MHAVVTVNRGRGGGRIDLRHELHMPRRDAIVSVPLAQRAQRRLQRAQVAQTLRRRVRAPSVFGWPRRGWAGARLDDATDGLQDTVRDLAGCRIGF